MLHRPIREISGHAVALELIENLRNRLAHHAFRLALVPGRPSESLAQHQAIIDAVVAGDERLAELAMHQHLDSVVAVLRRFERLEG